MDPNQNPQQPQPYQPDQPPQPQDQWPQTPQPQTQPQPEQQFQQQPQPFPAAQPVPPASQENPGQILGIVSIVMIFVFPLLGIILGALSRNKSKAAGMPSGLGTAGMIINIVVTVIGLIVGVLFFILVIAAAGSEANTSGSFSTSDSSFSAESNVSSEAATVAKYAEAYKTKAGDYPRTTSDFDTYPESQIPDDITVFSMMFTSTAVTYLYCDTGAAQVVYLGDSDEDKRITALGTASSSVACKE